MKTSLKATVVKTFLVSWLCWHTKSDVVEELKTINMAPDDLNGTEVFTNLTIDQIILKAMGGYPGVSNYKAVGPDSSLLVELDMVVTRHQYHNLYDKSNTTRRKKRKAVQDTTLRWPDATLPYRIAKNHFTAKELYQIKRAMTEWERYSCLRFRKARPSDRDVVRIKNGQGCNSQLGMIGGMQDLNLEQPGCRYKGLYLHEIGHAIGLVHEHQLPDRDKYIDILYDNVQPDMKIWFDKYSTSAVNQLNVKYEYSSVMHYGISAFSKDGKAQTIKARDSTKEHTIGRVYLKELGFSDVKTVNLMYNCADRCDRQIRCTNAGILDENCKCICPDGSEECTDGRQGQNAQCTNRHESSWQCYIWARQGECERNPGFMTQVCRKACGVCEEQEEDQVCIDKYDTEKCKHWSVNGDCVTNSEWMHRNCKQTCNRCDVTRPRPDENCNNVHTNDEQCDQWAIEGECRVNFGWMMDKCKRSCQACAVPVITSLENEEEDASFEDACEDKYNEDQCRDWATKGECGANPQWMRPNCRKSCDVCGGNNECKDIHDSKQCQNWAQDGECAANPTWMIPNCRKSCDKCTTFDDQDAGQSHVVLDRLLIVITLCGLRILLS